MRAYYNEIDPNAAAWIRELIKEGVITDGEVDERSIEDVLPADVAGFDRVHWFAGIGVWDHALNIARWPDDRRVWTGSCPCQPFSAAGKGEGFADERHLWPALFHHILVGRPNAFFGEQVASADGLTWLDLVSSDLEGIAYTTAAVDIPVAGFGGPHRRQRLFFVADSTNSRREPITQPFAGSDREGMEPPEPGIESRNVCSSPNVLADAERRAAKRHRSELGATPRGMQRASRKQRLRSDVGNGGDAFSLGENPISIGRRRRRDGNQAGDIGQVQVEGLGTSGRLLADADRERCEEQCERIANGSEQLGIELPSITGSLEYSEGERQRGIAGIESGSEREAQSGREDEGCRISGIRNPSPTHIVDDSESQRWRQGRTESKIERRQFNASEPGIVNGFWHDAEWIYCRDEKYRPTKPGIFPLVNGAAGRVALLRGAGNAISPEVAKAFIESYLEIKL